MMSPDDVVTGLVALNGGRLPGRTRLQKTAFLLERCGMSSGLSFSYYRYGPYSAELARGWDAAELKGRVSMTEHRGRQEMPYTEFTTDLPAPDRLGNLDAATVRR